MKRKLRFIFGWTVLWLCFWIVQNTVGQSSANYTLKSSVVDQGGGISSSLHYRVSDAIGQVCPIGGSVSTGYHEVSGFLGSGEQVSGFLEEVGGEIPKAFELFQNYPNPFNPETRIRFDLPVFGDVELVIYDLQGEEVYRVREQGKSPGSYEVRWNGQDAYGKGLASGVYLYRIEVRGKERHYVQTRKMIFMK